MQQYDPFKYPADYEIAQLHKRCSMPGSTITPYKICECCNKKQKKSFSSWLGRSISKDFQKQGGSVVTYFWLLKFYTLVIGFIIGFYGFYLTYLIQQNCNQYEKQCQKFLGLWVVSNQNFIKILKKTDSVAVTILLTLRGITFIILMITNALSLFIVKLFKRIHPSELSISDYSLIFKNVKISTEQLIKKLKQQYPQIQIKQVVQLNSLQPYYSLNKQKITTYYQVLNCLQQKQLKKLQTKLIKLNKQCKQSVQRFEQQKYQRILVVLNTIEQKKMLLSSKYQGKYLQKLMNYFGMASQLNNQNDRIYCQPAPKVQQIIWNNIGSSDQHKIKYKLLSIVYFIFLLVANYALFFLCMEMIYNKWFQQPWNTIFINVILTLLVAAALSFRANMNKLSQLSHPSTYTNRTMFIVLTTVSFHLLFYLIIPTFYFSWALDQHKTQILKMIMNQVLNFVVFQFIIVGVDLMHYKWNKRLKIIQNRQKPYGCQKIIHQNIQYPRFPIQFKLIILFKLWSFTIFFAFQCPLILLFIFITLVFLFFKDKHSLYYHYRMQMIQNKVQFNFLRIYSTFFSIYMCIIFLLTQHLQIEFWLAIGFTIGMILVQLGFIGRRFQDKEQVLQQNGTLLLPPCFDQLEKEQSYKKVYQNFISRIQSKQLDKQIDQYMGKIDSNQNIADNQKVSQEQQTNSKQ